VDAFKYAGENIIFASGSPFEDVPLGLYYLSWYLWLFGLIGILIW